MERNDVNAAGHSETRKPKVYRRERDFFFDPRFLIEGVWEAGRLRTADTRPSFNSIHTGAWSLA
jgi:hypothetical protein